MKDSWLARGVVVLLLLAFLLVPLKMIEGLVAEREARRRAAVDEIGSTWGGPQTLLGPVLVLPHRVIRKESVETAYAAFLPERLKVEGTLVPERRHRGIFEVVVYTGTLAVSGTLPPSDVRALGLDPDNVAFADAFLSVALTDTRGIREEPVLLLDGARVAFRPGAGDAGLGAAGLHAPLPAFDPGRPHTFSFTLRLQGTESISVAPLGASTEASLASPWPSPSFSGSFLPETRRTGPDGFTAAWRVSSFGRAYPQSWKACPPSDAIARSVFGARLFLPADAYQQTTRALKYAVLFVGLTFLAFALFEVLGGVRLHPLQYLLAGFALALFYLLLLSLAEHAGFGPAYLAAAAATTLLIAGWGVFVLAAAIRALLLGAGLATLYAYLYVLLRLEDWALVLGAAALFAILAGVMFGTRRVDWWTLGRATAPPRAFSPPPA